jgi:predicted Zn-dependent protease
MNLRWFSGVALTLVIGVQALFPGICKAEGEDDPLWNKPSYDKKIIQVGQRILAANGIKERISFYYVSKDVRNADARRWFSPNTIRVFKDITDIVSSDDELAAVLAHEIAHIVNRHTRKAILTKAPIILGTTALMGATVVATGGLAAPIAIGLGGDAIVRPIDRGLETNADMTGLDFMVKAGYNPLAMETIMTKITADAGIVTSFFSDHPLGTKRIARIHEAIKQKYPQFLTDELANNPVPGSPYQLQPKEKKKKKKDSQNAQLVKAQDKSAESAAAGVEQTVTPKSADLQALGAEVAVQPGSADNAAKSDETEAQRQVTSQASKPEPIVAVSVAEEKSAGEKTEPATAGAAPAKTALSSAQEGSALKPAPKKTNYTPPGNAIKKAPASQNYAARTMPQKPSLASAGAGGDSVVRQASAASVAMALLELNSDQQKALKLIAQRHYLSREDLKEYYPGWEPDLLDALVNALLQKKLIRILGGDGEEQGYVLTDSASAVLEKTK